MADVLSMPASGELFHTAIGAAFADLFLDGHRQTWAIRSKRFRAWLKRHYYRETGTALSAAAMRSTLDLLEARAQFDGPEGSVHVRVAEHAGRIYLDLADECWRAVEISPDGWRVIGAPPVRFLRAPGMLPLPVPRPDGSIETLLPLLNIATHDDLVLILTWLLATLRPRGPYPVLALSGEQGSAKTVLSKLLKALIDPNVAPVRSLVREERDLMIAANHGHLLAFDNLSDLPVSLSDAFCRLATGASFARRQGVVSGSSPHPLKQHRGRDPPPGPGRSRDLSDARPNRRAAEALRGEAMARIRNRAAVYSRCFTQCRRAWPS